MKEDRIQPPIHCVQKVSHFVRVAGLLIYTAGVYKTTHLCVQMDNVATQQWDASDQWILEDARAFFIEHYLLDPKFTLSKELAAHRRVQYAELRLESANRPKSDPRAVFLILEKYAEANSLTVLLKDENHLLLSAHEVETLGHTSLVVSDTLRRLFEPTVAERAQMREEAMERIQAKIKPHVRQAWEAIWKELPHVDGYGMVEEQDINSAMMKITRETINPTASDRVLKHMNAILRLCGAENT